MPQWPEKARDRMLGSLTAVADAGLDGLCEHAQTGVDAVYFDAWAPGKVRCARCAKRAADRAARCDECRRPRRTRVFESVDEEPETLLPGSPMVVRRVRLCAACAGEDA